MILYEVMLQLSFNVLVSFSFFNRIVTKDSLTILFYGTGSIFQCGGFCMEDSYCIQFLYNAKKNFFGIHEEYSEWYSYQNVITNADEVQRFHKKNEMKQICFVRSFTFKNQHYLNSQWSSHLVSLQINMLIIGLSLLLEF